MQMQDLDTQFILSVAENDYAGLGDKAAGIILRRLQRMEKTCRTAALYHMPADASDMSALRRREFIKLALRMEGEKFAAVRQAARAAMMAELTMLEQIVIDPMTELGNHPAQTSGSGRTHRGQAAGSEPAAAVRPWASAEAASQTLPHPAPAASEPGEGALSDPACESSSPGSGQEKNPAGSTLPPVPQKRYCMLASAHDTAYLQGNNTPCDCAHCRGECDCLKPKAADAAAPVRHIYEISDGDGLVYWYSASSHFEAASMHKPERELVRAMDCQKLSDDRPLMIGTGNGEHVQRTCGEWAQVSAGFLGSGQHQWTR